MALVLALAACSGAPPGSAVPEHLAPNVGPNTATTPLAAIIRDNAIRELDPAAPLLPQLERELAKSDPAGRFRGITYELTRGNALDRDWIVQSPTLWGRKAAKLPPGHSDALVERVRQLVAGARRSIDIAALRPAPDGRFLAALNAGLAEAATRGQPIAVRLLVGHYPTADIDATALFKQIHAAPQLSIHVAALRSCVVPEDCDGYSWNHAKILAIDGRVALVGGHNLWTDDYLVDRPVHDLSMVARGPAAASASRFVDELWRFVCANAESRKPAVQLAGGCPRALGREPSARAGNLDVLSVGRLGVGITKDFANHSELARDLLIGAARKSIRIAQQDLGFKLGRSDTLFPETALERLADFVDQGGDVYIVLSNPGAVGLSGSTYTNDVPVETFAKRLRAIVARNFERLTQRGQVDKSPERGPDRANALLCNRIHLAPLRFGPDDKWPGGATLALHAKFFMVDDRAFYIGSDNMYPVNLQEFGYMVDDARASRELLDAWWNPMWQWSSRAALSGPGVEKCIFREVPRG
ncbi:MAG TPA: hypothetical protein VEC14_05695 [Reyranellaceae bacterium]|nr:hypothetical protein [Reyranellaceae bacterium]